MRSKSVIILSLYSPSVNNYLHVNHTNFVPLSKIFLPKGLMPGRKKHVTAFKRVRRVQ